MDKPTPPVRVKLYGFLNLTRRTYYVLLGLVVLVLVAAMLFWAQAGRGPIDREHALPGTMLLIWVWDNIPWIVLVGVLLSSIEVWLVLRKFGQEEERQRTKQP